MGESMTFQYLASFDITDARNNFGSIELVRFPLGNFSLNLSPTAFAMPVG